MADGPILDNPVPKSEVSETPKTKGDLLRDIRGNNSNTALDSGSFRSGIEITRRRLLGGALTTLGLGLIGGIFHRSRETNPTVSEKEALAGKIKDFEERIGNEPLTEGIAQSFAPLKLYSLTFPLEVDEVVKKIKFDSRTQEQIYSDPSRESQIEDEEDFSDNLYLTFFLESLNKEDRYSFQYQTQNEEPKKPTPIAKFRAELLHNLFSWQSQKAPEKEVDSIFAKEFTTVEMSRPQSYFDQALRQAFGKPSSHFRAEVKARGFDFISDYFDDMDRRMETGGSFAMETIISGYLLEKLASDNGLSFVQVSYDFDPEEFSSFSKVMEKARLSDIELYSMVMDSNPGAFITRLSQAQTGLQLNSEAQSDRLWLRAFSDELDRTVLWIALARAFPGTKFPSIARNGYPK